MFCVSEYKDAKAHFAFFFNFSFYHSFITHMGYFSSVFSATTQFRIMKFCVHLHVGKVYCVNENLDASPHFAFFFQIFNFSLCHSCITRRDIFHQFSLNLLD